MTDMSTYEQEQMQIEGWQSDEESHHPFRNNIFRILQSKRTNDSVNHQQINKKASKLKLKLSYLKKVPSSNRPMTVRVRGGTHLHKQQLLQSLEKGARSSRQCIPQNPGNPRYNPNSSKDEVDKDKLPLKYKNKSFGYSPANRNANKENRELKESKSHRGKVLGLNVAKDKLQEKGLLDIKKQQLVFNCCHSSKQKNHHHFILRKAQKMSVNHKKIDSKKSCPTNGELPSTTPTQPYEITVNSKTVNIQKGQALTRHKLQKTIPLKQKKAQMPLTQQKVKLKPKLSIANRQADLFTDTHLLQFSENFGKYQHMH